MRVSSKELKPDHHRTRNDFVYHHRTRNEFIYFLLHSKDFTGCELTVYMNHLYMNPLIHEYMNPHIIIMLVNTQFNYFNLLTEL